METNNNIVKDIQQIVEENKVQVIEVGDRRFTTKSLTEIKPVKNTAREIKFSDLSSIVAIVKREINRFDCPLYQHRIGKMRIGYILVGRGKRTRTAVQRGRRGQSF